MMRLRPIVRPALCCLLCLIVCAAPALAASDSGAVLYPGQNYCYLVDGTDLNNRLVNPFEHISATIDYSESGLTDIEGIKLLYLQSDIVHLDNQNVLAMYYNNVYFEVIFPCGNGGNLVISPDNIVTSSYLTAPLVYSMLEGQAYMAPFPSGLHADLLVDDVVVASYVEDSSNPVMWPDSFIYSGHVNNHFSLRFYFDSGSEYQALNIEHTGDYAGIVQLPYDIFALEGDPIEVDKIDVVIGKIDELNGSVQVIESNVVEINNNLSDIKNGLQDGNSSIWGAFKESVSGLFVPSADDLTGVKDGFDQLARDKLGGAYQTVDMVSGGVQSVSDKFKNPGSTSGVEFPGISVPLGGDVGTVTLAASQTVTIPEKMTEVLYPVSGIIIPIVCTIWTVRLGLDMVNCFMSGMSYGDFLHRHTDEEDNEV